MISLFIVEKNSERFRICLDPHDLNKNVQRPHYLIRTLEVDDLLEMDGVYKIGLHLRLLKCHVR